NYTVTYTDGNGCSATSAPTNVTVNPLPNVTQTPLSLVCDYDPAFTLSGASPAGGTYSGPGVSGGMFDPAVAGIGVHTITYEFTDGNGCTNTASEDLEVDACLSVEEFINDHVNIYPNPTSTELNVELEGEFDVTLFDSRGRVVYQGTGKDLITLSTEEYEAGVYLVQLKTEEHTMTVRVVKN
ncbi:MAG: T9SS type A sorting domain-containing protein, partial [Crocinitomicaceae bacterium]